MVLDQRARDGSNQCQPMIFFFFFELVLLPYGTVEREKLTFGSGWDDGPQPYERFFVRQALPRCNLIQKNEADNKNSLIPDGPYPHNQRTVHRRLGDYWTAKLPPYITFQRFPKQSIRSPSISSSHRKK
jgi:hypothetical protein